jgi:hypothetical protein
MRGILKGCLLAGAGFVLGRACSIYQAEQALKNAPEQEKERFESVIFGTEKDARMVLSELKGVIERYGAASVADFYDLAGIVTQFDYEATRRGWTSLSNAEIVPVSGGFEIRFPSVQPII